MCALFVYSSAGCYGTEDGPCPQSVHLNARCATLGDCSIDDQIVAGCSNPDPDCPLHRLASGQTLRIPLTRLWDDLSSRDDLLISLGAFSSPDIRNATLLFDGTAETSCTRNENEIECLDVPRTTTSIEFRYDDGSPDVDVLTYLHMVDKDCLVERDYPR